MLDVSFFADLIRVTLLGAPFPHLPRAIPLLLGTCAQESAFTHTTQIGGGPAKGLFQCEPATEEDIWINYLQYQETIRTAIVARCGVTEPNPTALEHNMVYQILMARTHYYRCDPDPLPPASDVEEQAVRYKKYYNTVYGAATEEDYIQSYARLVAPYYVPPGGHAHG